MTVLTAERLVRLAYKYPSLENTWFLVACACLLVVNQPQEIPKLFHFALRQQLLTSRSGDLTLLTNRYLHQLAHDLVSLAQAYADFTAVGVGLPDVLIPHTYHDKLPLAYKFSRGEDIHALQMRVATKLREVLLKSIALAGLPKAINALMILKNVTPSLMLPHATPVRPLTVHAGRVPSLEIACEDVEGTNFEEDSPSRFVTTDTLDGPICPDLVDARQIQHDLTRGLEFWNTVYSAKVNMRIRKQMLKAYPDLWYYAYHHAYAPLLSFTDVLLARETSMCIVASLIPQDVNPQLKGHLRGAINVGVTRQELAEIRQLVFDICDWSGNVTWRDGQDSVAKL